MNKICKVPAFRELTTSWRESGENNQVKLNCIGYVYIGRHSAGERGEELLDKMVTVV